MSEFKVGDKVFCLSNGNGFVTEIGDAKDSYCKKYPVKVTFENSIDDDYSEYGFYQEFAKFQMLYHGHDLIVEVKETEYEWQVIHSVDGEYFISPRFYKSINDYLNEGTRIYPAELFEPSKRLVKKG